MHWKCGYGFARKSMHFLLAAKILAEDSNFYASGIINLEKTTN